MAATAKKENAMDDIGNLPDQSRQDEPGNDSGEMETMQRPIEMSMPMGMISRPSVSVDVRRMNKEGLLRDEAVAFGLSCQSGDKVLVFANREAVRLSYAADGKELSQDVRLAWTDGRPWFVCACERQVTKLHLYGSRFICHRCLQGPPRRRSRRITKETRLRVLARDGFRCVGCHEQDGLTVASPIPPLPGSFFFEYDYHDDELIAVCSFCRLPRRPSAGKILAVLGRRLSVETSEYGRLWADAPRLSSLQIAEMHHRCDLDTNSEDKTDSSVHQRRKQRRKERQEQTHRVLIRLLLGHACSEIARDEGVSRQTAWRQRKRLDEVVMPVARALMWRAAQKKDWEEARLWWECLTRVGVDINAEEKASGKEAKQMRKLLEAVRDELLGRAQARREEAA